MLKTVALVWCPMKDSINRRRHESAEVLFISFFGWNQKDLAESNRSMQSHVCSDLNVTSQPVSFGDTSFTGGKEFDDLFSAQCRAMTHLW